MDTVSIDRSNASQTPNIGDPFNPSRHACGFFPADIVGRRRELTDGPKRLYQRLVWFGGCNGECYPSERTLAKALGKSDRQIRRDIGVLKKYELIDVRPRQGRRSNTYLFLWHEWFTADRTSASAQDVASVEDDRTSAASDRPPAATLSGHVCPPNSVYSYNKKSSSKKRLAPPKRTFTTFDGQAIAKTTSSGMRWWNVSEITSSAKVLYAIRYGLRFEDVRASDPLPDAQYVAGFLDIFPEADAWKAWVHQAQQKKWNFRNPGFGLLKADAATWIMTWAEIKAEIATELEHEKRKQQARIEQAEARTRILDQIESIRRACREKGWQEVCAVECSHCGGFGRNPNTEEVCSCSAGEEWIQINSACNRCQNSGFTRDLNGRYAWCTCGSGERMKKEKGADALPRSDDMRGRRKSNIEPVSTIFSRLPSVL